ASIIGHIRQAALGETLIPFEQRVQKAMQKIYAEYEWTPVQRRWLERLASQLTHAVVIDKSFVNERFARDGGARQLDKILVNRLDAVLTRLADEVWKEAS